MRRVSTAYPGRTRNANAPRSTNRFANLRARRSTSEAPKEPTFQLPNENAWTSPKVVTAGLATGLVSTLLFSSLAHPILAFAFGGLLGAGIVRNQFHAGLVQRFQTSGIGQRLLNAWYGFTNQPEKIVRTEAAGSSTHGTEKPKVSSNISFTEAHQLYNAWVIDGKISTLRQPRVFFPLLRKVFAGFSRAEFKTHLTPLLDLCRSCEQNYKRLRKRRAVYLDLAAEAQRAGSPLAEVAKPTAFSKNAPQLAALLGERMDQIQGTLALGRSLIILYLTTKQTPPAEALERFQTQARDLGAFHERDKNDALITYMVSEAPYLAPLLAL